MKACIFDLDGTLTDSVKSLAYSANLTLKDLGYEPQPEECFKLFAGDGRKVLLERVLKASGDEALVHLEEAIKIYDGYFSKNSMYEVKPYAGILETLQSLKEKGMHLAVLSNKPHKEAVKVVETIFGTEMFEIIRGQQEGIERKPSPVGALMIAEQLKVKTEECLYIGDTNTDMQTGNSAGMNTVGVTWGFRERKELEDNHARYIIDIPQELVALCENK